ncbi:MAG: alpha/beta hydrolase [Geminicoccaceae bacterium]
MSRRRLLLAGAATLALPRVVAADALAPPAARPLPARLLPVPQTVSPQLQERIAAPYPPGWDSVPADAAAWRKLQADSAAAVLPHLPALKERLGIDVAPATIAGVPVFAITPRDVPPANRDRLLVHVHGGGYVLYPGEAGAGEAMLLAGQARIPAVSVDYRMPPDHPFPAALDDAIAVWRELARQRDPRRLAIVGSSAGGGLTLAMILQAKALGLPLPAAIAAGTPWADLTNAGDSLHANAYVDNELVAATGWIAAAARLYAAGRDLRDPLVSPLHGDFAGFPPAIVTSGTRDLLLSQAVLVHRKLRRAGVDAALQVFEGQSHAQYLAPFVPESEEALGEIAGFLTSRMS